MVMYRDIIREADKLACRAEDNMIVNYTFEQLKEIRDILENLKKRYRKYMFEDHYSEWLTSEEGKELKKRISKIRRMEEERFKSLKGDYENNELKIISLCTNIKLAKKIEELFEL